MNKSEFHRKRRAKNRRKNKTWKRTKLPQPRLFQETSFDSSEENETITDTKIRPDKSLDYPCKNVINLNPSKSENVNQNAEDPEIPEIVISDFDDEKDIPCVLNDSRFEISSNEDSSYFHTSVLEEFMTDFGHNSSASIVSAEIQGVNGSSTEDEIALDVDLTWNKVKKSKKNSELSPATKKMKMKNQICLDKELDSEEVKDSQKNMKKSKKKNSDTANNSELLSPAKKKTKTENSVSSNQENIIFNKEVQYHNINDGIIVILEENDTIYFHGLCLLTVLHGQIEVLGHTLTKNYPEAKLYSPRGSSLLYLKNMTESEVPITDYLINLKIKMKITKNCGVVFCKKLQEDSISFIEKHISQQILPQLQENRPRVVFQPTEGSWNLLKIHQEWDTLIEKITKNTKLMICGGKGVGKTTFLRYAINKLLMKFDEIQIIDLDPGQSEFTVPGCLSIVKVTQPIFGINYTHLQKSERSILSDINIAYDPNKYISSVKELINTNLSEVPILINYMGYTHGIGMNILSAVITHIEPSDILQISSGDSKKNYKFILEKDIVRENAKLFTFSDVELSYNLHQIQSMSDKNDSWTAEPRQLREMCVLSYISHMVDFSVFRNKVLMYRISLKEIDITNLNGEKIHPAAVNACLVALCNLENEEKKIFQCFSWGIVRGIDLAANELLLLTSEKIETLDKITHLVSSNSVNLPPSVYMTADEVIGLMPYVIEGTLMSFGQITKRSRLSVKK